MAAATPLDQFILNLRKRQFIDTEEISNKKRKTKNEKKTENPILFTFYYENKMRYSRGNYYVDHVVSIKERFSMDQGRDVVDKNIKTTKFLMHLEDFEQAICERFKCLLHYKKQKVQGVYPCLTMEWINENTPSLTRSTPPYMEMDEWSFYYYVPIFLYCVSDEANRRERLKMIIEFECDLARTRFFNVSTTKDIEYFIKANYEGIGALLVKRTDVPKDLSDYLICIERNTPEEHFLVRLDLDKIPPSFIEKRRIVIFNGFGYTTLKEYITRTADIKDRENRESFLFLGHILYILEKKIEEIHKANFFSNKNSPKMDHRLLPIKNTMERMFLDYESFVSLYINNGADSEYRLPSKAACFGYLPPCIGKIHQKLTDDGEISFDERPIYINFFRSVGFSQDEIVTIFDKHYKKKNREERAEKWKQCRIEVQQFSNSQKNLSWSCAAVQNRGHKKICPFNEQKECSETRIAKRPSSLPDIEDLGDFYSPFSYYKSLFKVS